VIRFTGSIARGSKKFGKKFQIYFFQIHAPEIFPVHEIIPPGKNKKIFSAKKN